jgi:hypothetical protein
VVQVPFPLPSEAYLQLVRGADVGLFLYDSARYYGRCSGVLVEMLCSGIPVAVPAGCWLSDEISSPLQAHLFQLGPGVLGTPVELAVATAAPTAAAAAAAAVAVPAGAHAALVELVSPAWHGPQRFIQCDACLQPQASAPHALTPQIMAPSADSAAARALLRLQSAPGVLTLRLSSAFDSTAVPLSSTRVWFLHGDPPVPAGAVGAPFADPRQSGPAVRELILHHSHYTETARSFSQQYRLLHHPRRTLQELLDRAA